ncbi:Siroheme synthase / Precorrin-2 oxidase [Acidisarcina polymorpha]|uniref:Siroheme synthase / Precorrin-2 oxidase n=1 Tax=Acidisarcina polymorpha TaxID=2211140 RepID=A0A2Z5FY80_9BACT|nr:siroheme synthase CysG [Acidisarcina polymorpha]AXC11839.1 Siroheme synthase / Precorrin-2 oxidase [Acidisarcina polymorpha]
MAMLPIFLKLSGRRCLLVGAGTVALEKIGSLLKTGAKLTVIAPEARPEIQQLATEGRLVWIQRAFELTDLDGNFLVITATNVPQVNSAVYQGCLDRNVICNSVDDIPNCDFYFGSIVARGDLQIAISTAGESPAVAQRLRREIDEQLPEDLGEWLKNLGQLRREVLESHPRGDARKAVLHQLSHRQVCESPTCPSRRIASQAIPENSPNTVINSVEPKVYLVGAGPGDPDLLTVKALRLIQNAEVVLHDDLVPPAVLENASLNAEIVNVGKRCGAKNITQDEINALMVEHARAGRRVVRLKSGDPLIFGRAAEEMRALGEAGIAYEIVPGITAAFAAAAAIQCSLTDRNCASNVVFSTGQHAQSHNQSPLPEREDATRVVYMPGRDLTLLAAQWLDEGLPPNLPCVVVSRAAQPDQQVRCTTLAALGAAEAALAPSLLIAGWSVRNVTSAAIADVWAGQSAV